MRQTLEPKMYYTYVPYKNQSQIPIFDTTINTLTYDQLFTYNRFSGLDRLGDANQISLGVTTRFIDQESGYEKISAGIGQIFYFENRRVTLCTGPSSCNEVIDSPENTNNRSPLSAVLSYNLNPHWNATSYTIWDSQEKEFNNQTFTLQYARDLQRAISFSYSYVRNGDLPQNPESQVGKSATNLSQTDFSFTWPVSRDWSTVARWTENWNRSRFQNLLYGLQYDTCCWAVRVVAGRTFNNLTPNDTYQYNSEFYIQFALKGLGNFGTGNPGQILNNASIANQTNFGQDY
jgi:LPS-assembly protein